MKKFSHFFLIFSVTFSLYSQQSFSLENLLGANKPVVSERIEQLLDSSATYLEKGNYRRSLEFNIEFLIQAFTSENPYYIHQGYRMLGQNYRAMNDTILARESFEKSEKFAKKSENTKAEAIALMDLASIYSLNSQNLQKAFKYQDQSIELFEKINDSIGLANAPF